MAYFLLVAHIKEHPAYRNIQPFLFYVAIGIHLMPVWIAKYFVTGDGPSHLYNARVLLDFVAITWCMDNENVRTTDSTGISKQLERMFIPVWQDATDRIVVYKRSRWPFNIQPTPKSPFILPAALIP